jgi:biopolymer transport protein ExbB/TolQ
MIHRLALATAVALALFSPATAADPVLATARESIKKAGTEFLSTKQEYSDLRLGLYREVNKLDDEVLALSKELRTLERDEELRTSKVRSLEREVESRKADFLYASGVLNQYAKAIITRLHPAESQLYKTEIESLDQKATAATGDPKAEVIERAKILETGIKRLAAIAGGQRFEGKALGRAGQAVEGTLFLAGPAVLFASADKSFEGVASTADTGAGLPAIVPLAETNGSIAKAIESGSGEVPLDATGGRAIEAALKNPGGEHGGAMEHLALFGDIAKNMMFDGWIAIAVCVLMIGVGWTIAARKIFYLNSIEKGTKEFIRQWSLLSSDLTAIDHADKTSVSSLGGNADSATQSLIQKSPLYEIYHIGSDEIRHRLANDRTHKKGLTGRSIQAIRAALDAGMVRCQHKLTDGLVYLTISIAGGPYVGLLGTVVGVMITFALIAKSGEVDVNAIAPGIASALLATVAGLVVAIPALFVYSYLNNRIKGMVGEIQVFIDEFVAKMAEFYQGSENSGPVSKVIE